MTKFTMMTFNVLAWRYAKMYYNLEAFEEGLAIDDLKKMSKKQLDKHQKINRYLKYIEFFKTIEGIICLQEVDFILFKLLKNVRKFTILGYHKGLDNDYFAVGNVTLATIDIKKKFDVSCNSLIASYEFNIHEKSQLLTLINLVNEKGSFVVPILNVHLKGYNRYQEDMENRKIGSQKGLECLTNIPFIYLNTAIILGDFNGDLQRDTHQECRKEFMQKLDLSDYTLDVTEPSTGTAIDRIWYSKNYFILTPHDIVSPQGSDHLPVAVDVEFFKNF